MNATLKLFALAGLALCTLGFAKTPSSVSGSRHVTSVAAPGHLGFSDDGTLHLVLSPQPALSLSPLLSAVSLRQGPTAVGFRATHEETTLGQAVSYYYDTLTGLGFSGALEHLSADMLRYSFTKGERDISAVFVQQEDAITVTVSWTPLLIAGN